MPRHRKPIGRPSEKVLPPRINAPVETVANVVLNAGRPKGKKATNTLYYCRDCKRQVSFPETLYSNGCGKDCH